jgi:glucosamine--fructose-6-phosphate aminotransferase (isomerizing)
MKLLSLMKMELNLRYSRDKIKKELKTADWNIEAAQKGGYEHFMLKEIHEQPSAVKNTVSPRVKNGLPDFSECGLTDESCLITEIFT